MSSPGETAPQIETPEMRTIVEIGAGRIGEFEAINGESFWKAVPEYRTFTSEEQYIGIDLGVRTLEPVRGYDNLPECNDPALVSKDPEVRKQALRAREAAIKAYIDTQDQNMRNKWTGIQAERPEEKLFFLQANGAGMPLPAEVADEVIISNLFAYGAPDYSLASIYDDAQRILKPSGEIIIHDDHMSRFVTDGALPQWISKHRLPEPASVTRLNYIADPKAYVAAAKRYGVRYERYAINTTPEEARELGAYDLDTIWILGKATMQTKPETPETVFKRWKDKFGKYFNS